MGQSLDSLHEEMEEEEKEEEEKEEEEKEDQEESEIVYKCIYNRNSHQLKQ